MNYFYYVYSTAVACPILAKQSYLESGFITPRPWEALMFGTIPIGLSSHTGIKDYCEVIAEDASDMSALVGYLSKVSPRERGKIRKDNIEKIRFMDVSNFINKIEDVANA